MFSSREGPFGAEAFLGGQFKRIATIAAKKQTLMTNIVVTIDSDIKFAFKYDEINIPFHIRLSPSRSGFLS